MEKCLSWSLMLLFFAIHASADTPQERYLDALKRADRHVVERRQREARAATARTPHPGSPSALVAESPEAAGPRPHYLVGDSWKVVSVSIAPGVVRKRAEAGQARERVKRIGVFRYEVLAVNGNEATVRITQLEELGLAPVDPKVQSVTVVVDRGLGPSRKSYRLAGRPDEISVAGDLRSRLSALEFFPLDLPDLRSSKRSQGVRSPELPPDIPEELKPVLDRAGHRGAFDRAIWHEQDDPFGRRIEAAWREGEPWPAYLRDPRGISILIRDGG